MQRLIIPVILILLLSFAFPGAAQPQRYSDTYTDSFDTVITFIAFADSPEVFAKTSAQVHSLYQHLHKLYDRYNSYEDEGIINVYTLNEKAAKEPVKVDPLLFTLLRFAQDHYSDTNGQTNIAMGKLLGIWHDYREAGLADPARAQLPPMEALQAAAEHCDIDRLILDSENMTVFFDDPEMQLDVGAVAKGYATELVAKMLENTDVRSYIISAGGNVRLGNAPLDGRPNWGVGVQAPDGDAFSHSEIAETLYLSDCSIVTSGDYQRYYEVDGVRYSHLIDPDTLMPGSYFRSVTIITADSGYADLLSTAAFLMPYEDSRAFIENLPGVEALWLFEDGSEEMTDGIRTAAKSAGAVNKRK